MFEITISTTKSKSADISFLIERLRPMVKNVKGIMVCEEFEGRSKLAIAIKKEKKVKCLPLIYDAVAEVIIKDYKEEFLRENLKLEMNNEVSKYAFIKALTMFDKSSDKLIIKKQLTGCEEIVIDSLYNFRLWELTKRWREIAELVSENSSYLIMSGTFLELMKFLILTNETIESEVHLHFQSGRVYGQTKEGKEVFKIAYSKQDDNGKIGVISELIAISPERIVLHSDIEDVELSNYILSLFDGKVSVLK